MQEYGPNKNWMKYGLHIALLEHGGHISIGCLYNLSGVVLAPTNDAGSTAELPPIKQDRGTAGRRPLPRALSTSRFTVSASMHY